MKPGRGYATLKPKDWTQPREPLLHGSHAVEPKAQARPPRRTYVQQSHIGRIFIPSSMCRVCIERKRVNAIARAFWDHQPAPVRVTDERVAGIIGSES